MVSDMSFDSFSCCSKIDISIAEMAIPLMLIGPELILAILCYSVIIR